MIMPLEYKIDEINKPEIVEDRFKIT